MCHIKKKLEGIISGIISDLFSRFSIIVSLFSKLKNYYLIIFFIFYLKLLLLKINFISSSLISKYSLINAVLMSYSFINITYKLFFTIKTSSDSIWGSNSINICFLFIIKGINFSIMNFFLIIKLLYTYI